MSKYQILPALPGHDHRVVTLNQKNIGWISTDKTIGLETCGSCHRENYSLSVLRGRCAWCGWDIDEEEILKLEEL